MTCRLRSRLLSLAALALLAGCGAAQPGSLATPSLTPTAGRLEPATPPDPTPVPSQSEASAQGGFSSIVAGDTNALEQAIYRYYKELEEAANSGATGELASVIAPECKCLETVEYIAQHWADGRSIRGVKYSVEAVDSLIIRGKIGSAHARFSVSSYEELDRNGLASEIPALIDKEVGLTLQWSSGGWLMMQVAVTDA